MKLRRFVIAFVLVLLVCAFLSWIISDPPQTLEERQAIISAKQERLVQAFADQRANERKAEVERARSGRQNYANDVIGSILYIQDPRTTPPTCYAYLSSRRLRDDNGPSLATVPCEAIPPDLLIVATTK